MYGYSRNSGIRWFRNYNEANQYYENTENIRGRKVEPLKPLGQRRSVDAYSIVKGESGEIECVCYKTPVVTFMPDGEIHIKDYHYTTQTTANFIGDVLNIPARVFNNSLCVQLSGKEYRLPEGGKDVLRIVCGEDGHFVPLNAQTEVRRNIDRANANKVRAGYKEFVDYAVAIAKLKNEGFSDKEFEDEKVNKVDLSRSNYTMFSDGMRSFVALVNDASDNKHHSWYKATMMLAQSFGSWSYRDNSRRITEHGLRRGMDTLILGLHRDAAFKTITAEDGDVKRDAYQKYFSTGWERFHTGK